MNRRDTILVAVLVNVGLVLVLFVLGIKPATPVELVRAHEAKQTQALPISVSQQEEVTTIDQVDQILSKYIAVPEVKEIEPVEVKTPLPKPEKPAMQVATTTDKNFKEVIVRQGDVLEKIAKHHKTTVEEIMKVNGLSSTRLQIGQILVIPTDVIGVSVVKATNGHAKEVKYYVVKTGDNPWTIAVKNKLRVEELLRLNQLDESKAKKLKPGDKLRIQ